MCITVNELKIAEGWKIRNCVQPSTLPMWFADTEAFHGTSNPDRSIHLT